MNIDNKTAAYLLRKMVKQNRNQAREIRLLQTQINLRDDAISFALESRDRCWSTLESANSLISEALTGTPVDREAAQKLCEEIRALTPGGFCND